FSRLLMIEAVANLLLSIALVGPLGIEGVALGTSIPNALVNCAVVVYVCRSLHVSVAYYLRRAFAAPLLLGGLLAAIWLILAIPAARWSALITTGSLGLAVYAALAI